MELSTSPPSRAPPVHLAGLQAGPRSEDILTLLVIPSVYTIVDDIQRVLASLPRRMRRLAGGVHVPHVEPMPAPAQFAGSSAAD